jgi:hypothetical protein
MSYDLRQQLEEFTSGRCSAPAFAQGLSAFCRAQPEQAWQALALIDQYHRRGKIAVEVYRTLSHGIERQALERQRPGSGIREAPRFDPSADTDVTVPGLVGALEMQRRATLGSREAAEIPPAHSELVRARGEVQKYQNCLAMLARIDRRNRGALATALRELATARAQAADSRAQMKPDLSRRDPDSRGADRPEAPAAPGDPRPGRTWHSRLPLALCLVTLLLSMSAPPVL